MDKLREQIKNAVDSIDDETVTKYAAGVDKLYSLMEDVAVKFAEYLDEPPKECKQIFTYFITNIYKQDEKKRLNHIAKQVNKKQIKYRIT
jgi:hypothetical protein